MPEHIPEDERLSVLVAIAELKGQVGQALSQITAHAGRLEGIETRLRVAEQEQATARGKAAVTSILAGGGISVVVAVVVFAIQNLSG